MPSKQVRKTVKTKTVKPVSRKPSTTVKTKPKTVKQLSYVDKIITVQKKHSLNKIWVLDNVEWEERSLVGKLGGKWDNIIKQFIFVGEVLPEVLKKYENEPYSLTRWIQDDLNNNTVLPDTVKTFIPRPHQVEGINKIVSSFREGWRGFIEADNVGIGKSLICLNSASEIATLKGHTNSNPAKLLIICPKAVIPHWRNTISKSGVNNLRIMVINYDKSKNLLTVPETASTAKTIKTKNRRIANFGESVFKWDIIIADESHKMKNFEKSQRAKSFSNIAEYDKPYPAAPFIIWATATIGQNPVEVGYLAPLIGQMSKTKLGLKNFGDWLIRNGFNVKKGKVGHNWITVKTTDTPETIKLIKTLQQEDIKKMSNILFNNTAPSIRRNPEDITDYPEITRITVPYSLTVAEKLTYIQAWLEFRAEMSLNPKGKNPAGALAAQLRFRQKASILMVPYTVEYILELLDNNIKVAVSVEFIETLNLIRNELVKHNIKVSEFSGVNSETRESDRIKFQKNTTEVILFTVEEGVSFHSNEMLPDGSQATPHSRATIIHDVRYSAIACTQIEGRTHRDGQKANIYYPYFENTVQEKIVNIMIQRMSNMKQLSGDNNTIIVEIEKLLETFN
jgi:SNF2 family DNA or RNA helicase